MSNSGMGLFMFARKPIALWRVGALFCKGHILEGQVLPCPKFYKGGFNT